MLTTARHVAPEPTFAWSGFDGFLVLVAPIFAELDRFDGMTHGDAERDRADDLLERLEGLYAIASVEHPRRFVRWANELPV